MQPFSKIEKLPPYVFEVVSSLKLDAIKRGEDIIDFGMGNPDQPPAPHIIEKLIAAAQRPDAHRYCMSRGIPALRQAICKWYQRRYNVNLNPESEAITVIGSKEGLAHLALITMEPGDRVLLPSPCYPIHLYGNIIAGAQVEQISTLSGEDFFENLLRAINDKSKRPPKMLILNFPCNPTTQCVELSFFEKVIAIAKEYGIWVVHDLAYGDLVFDGYQAPSILQIPGAKDVAVEFFTLSKSYNMPGWRVGFMCGNPTLVAALARLKSYFDYGMFGPIQEAAVAALEGPQDCVAQICDTYRRRRDLLCEGLNALGWEVTPPKATMFVWAKIPPAYQALGSLEFAKRLVLNAKVAVSPGIGFGDYGDDHVRFGLIENEARIKQALQGIENMFKQDQLIPDKQRATSA